jgi:hypothetical protein
MFLTTPAANLVQIHRSQGNSGTVVGETFVAYDPNPELAGLTAADRTARWAVLGVTPASEIPRASNCEAVTKPVSPSDLAGTFPAGPDPAVYLAQAKVYAEAGVDWLSIVDCTPEIDAFLSFAAEHLVAQIHGLTPS